MREWNLVGASERSQITSSGDRPEPPPVGSSFDFSDYGGAHRPRAETGAPKASDRHRWSAVRISLATSSESPFPNATERRLTLIALFEMQSGLGSLRRSFDGKAGPIQKFVKAVGDSLTLGATAIVVEEDNGGILCPLV